MRLLQLLGKFALAIVVWTLIGQIRWDEISLENRYHNLVIDSQVQTLVDQVADKSSELKSEIKTQLKIPEWKLPFDMNQFNKVKAQADYRKQELLERLPNQ